MNCVTKLSLVFWKLRASPAACRGNVSDSEATSSLPTSRSRSQREGHSVLLCARQNCLTNPSSLGSVVALRPLQECSSMESNKMLLLYPFLPDNASCKVSEASTSSILS